MKRYRLPSGLRLLVKEWLCEFAIVGSMVNERDVGMRARDRMYAASKRPWLLRYEDPLIRLRIMGNGYASTE